MQHPEQLDLIDWIEAIERGEIVEQDVPAADTELTIIDIDEDIRSLTRGGWGEA